jgi:hypothetical protein
VTEREGIDAAILVSLTHWDGDWDRTFQEFRALLVDVLDALLDLLDGDDGHCFVLDGQSILLEDSEEDVWLVLESTTTGGRTMCRR